MTPPAPTTAPAAPPASPSVSSAWTAILCLFLGIFATSFAAIFVRISELELGPCGTIFNRFWIAAVVLGVGLGIQRIVAPQTARAQDLTSMAWQDWGLLVFAGLIAAVDLPALAFALSRTSVANATVLSDLSPLFTTLGAWLILKQFFDQRFWTGLCLSLVGVGFIGLADFQVANDQLFGDGVALVSALTLSLYLLTVEQLRTRLSTSTILFWSSTFAALFTAVTAWGLEGQLLPTSSQGWLAAMGLGLISQTLGQGLIAFSLNKVSAGLAALMFLLEPIMSATGAWILFAETLSVLNAIAFSLVLVGIYVAVTSPSALKEAPSG